MSGGLGNVKDGGEAQRRQPGRKASDTVLQGEGHSGWP